MNNIRPESEYKIEPLDYPPYPGALGQKIYEQISKMKWQEWLDHQTMLINEYRLDLTEQKSYDFLQTEMEKFLFGAGSDKPQGYKAHDA